MGKHDQGIHRGGKDTSSPGVEYVYWGNGWIVQQGTRWFSERVRVGDMLHQMSKRILCGSFSYEVSPKAGSYRGELLGLVVIHTFINGISTFYKLEQPSRKICCKNLAALDQSGR